MVRPDRLHALFAAALTVALMSPGAAAPPTKDATSKDVTSKDAPAAQTDDEDDAPTPAPLTVGSMALASDIDLMIDSMAVDIQVDKVVYAYGLHNKGKSKLALAASVAMPDLEVNNEGNSEYDLPSGTAENPVGLAVSVDGKVIPTQAYTQAVALGIDRLADLKAAQMPLIPFGDEIDKALAAAKPETLAKLEGLGLVTPRDPAQPDTPIIADWSLRVVHGWTLSLDPGTASKIMVGFAPVKAVYMIDAQSLGGFDALKEQVCLTPKFMDAAKAMLKAKGSTAEVDDITLSNDGPARWLDNPPATVVVHKPKPGSVVAFCGMDAATADQPNVSGKMPGSSEAAGLRVLIFSNAGP